MTAWDEPSERNCYLEFHVTRLLRSFNHWTGKTLFDTSLPAVEQARQLFNALFVVLSHDTGSVLNYANRAGLNLFELTWEELITLPSRQTASRASRRNGNGCWRSSPGRDISIIIEASVSPRAGAGFLSSRPRYGTYWTTKARTMGRQQCSASGPGYSLMTSNFPVD
jgi:hypothetical protein